MWRLWAGMFGLNGLGLPAFGSITALANRLHLSTAAMPFGGYDIAGIVACLALAMLAPNTQRIMARYQPGLDTKGYHALPGVGFGSIRLRPLALAALAVL